jgi:hypothetical protein
MGGCGRSLPSGMPGARGHRRIGARGHAACSQLLNSGVPHLDGFDASDWFKQPPKLILACKAAAADPHAAAPVYP